MISYISDFLEVFSSPFVSFAPIFAFIAAFLIIKGIIHLIKPNADLSVLNWCFKVCVILWSVQWVITEGFLSISLAVTPFGG